MSVCWTRLGRKDVIAHFPPFLFECAESCMTTGCLCGKWWQWLCRHVGAWFLSYQGVISDLPLEAEGIFLNSVGCSFTKDITHLGPERLICHISSHYKSKAVSCQETPNAKRRGHLAAQLPEILEAAWHQFPCFSWKKRALTSKWCGMW